MLSMPSVLMFHISHAASKESVLAMICMQPVEIALGIKSCSHLCIPLQFHWSCSLSPTSTSIKNVFLPF